MKKNVKLFIVIHYLNLNKKIQGKNSVKLLKILRNDQLKNKSSRRVTYGNPCYSKGSKANSIYFLNEISVL
jgi:hypothetical protein